MPDNDVPIGMLAMYARFERDTLSELFGFWYFQEAALPSTKTERQAFFHDMMIGRCCQLSLKGSLDQIWEIIELSGQGKYQMPTYSELEDALKQHSPICVTFDDLAEAEGTSLELKMLARVTESLESVVSKINSRRDVVELDIEPGWNLAKTMRECLS
jgi:hypothetical protein